ncbi:MAG: hypothetical protein ACLFPE_09750 [Bacteroidales bacterium]
MTESKDAKKSDWRLAPMQDTDNVTDQDTIHNHITAGKEKNHHEFTVGLRSLLFLQPVSRKMCKRRSLKGVPMAR